MLGANCAGCGAVPAVLYGMLCCCVRCPAVHAASQQCRRTCTSCRLSIWTVCSSPVLCIRSHAMRLQDSTSSRDAGQAWALLCWHCSNSVLGLQCCAGTVATQCWGCCNAVLRLQCCCAGCCDWTAIAEAECCAEGVIVPVNYHVEMHEVAL